MGLEGAQGEGGEVAGDIIVDCMDCIVPVVGMPSWPELQSAQIEGDCVRVCVCVCVCVCLSGVCVGVGGVCEADSSSKLK